MDWGAFNVEKKIKIFNITALFVACFRVDRSELERQWDTIMEY